jgi:hypothetical protein
MARDRSPLAVRPRAAPRTNVCAGGWHPVRAVRGPPPGFNQGRTQ